jgi:N-acetylglutamate synthase-like GNAT family acetyltransferase
MRELVNHLIIENPTTHLPKLIGAFLENGELAGVYILAPYNIDTRYNLTPWLSSLFVREDLRSQGVGAKLIESVTKFAQESGYQEYYALTDIDNFYEKFDFKHVDSSTKPNGDPIKIYKKSAL